MEYGAKGAVTVNGGQEIRSIIVYATTIKDKASTLNTTVTSGSAFTGRNVAGDAGALKSQASSLHTTVNNLHTAQGESGNGTPLSGLSGQVTALQNATGNTGNNTEGTLHKAATDLEGDTNLVNAKAVIEKFNIVKAKYLDLSKEPEYQARTLTGLLNSEGSVAKQQVDRVDGAWNQLKANFENVCKALVKHYAGEVNTAASNQLNANPTITKAKLFKAKYDEFSTLFDSLPDEDVGNAKTTVQSQWDIQ